MDSLPVEIYLSIISYLKATDILKLRAVNARLKNILSCPSIWNSLALERLGLSLNKFNNKSAMLQYFKVQRISEHPEGYLIYAAMRGSINKLEICLNYVQAGVSADDALYAAVTEGHFRIVDRLLECLNVDPSMRNNILLRDAAAKGYTDIVARLLKDPRVDPSYKKSKALRVSVNAGHLRIVNLLLEDGRADPSSMCNIAIRTACANGHLQILNSLLLDPRTNPADANNSAIICAVQNGHKEIVERLLLDTRVNPAARYSHAISFATGQGYTDIVHLLLRDYRVRASLDENRIKFYLDSLTANENYDLMMILLSDSKISSKLVADEFRAYIRIARDRIK